MDQFNLIRIRSLIWHYASLISAADRMEQINFEPKFQQCINDVHHIVKHLSASFVAANTGLVTELEKNSYHFSWSSMEDRLNQLLAVSCASSMRQCETQSIRIHSD